MFYVDDGLVAAKTVAEADALVALAGSLFENRKIREPDDLGIHICRDHGAGTITLDQKDKAVALEAALGVFRRVQGGADVAGGVWGVAGGTTRGAHGGQAAVPTGGWQFVASGTMHETGFCIACCCSGGVFIGA
jgi:hypothetical protein